MRGGPRRAQRSPGRRQGIELSRNAAARWSGVRSAITADGLETVWIADDAPQGATLADARRRGAWPQVPAGDISTPTEADFGTVENGGVRQAVPITGFRTRWSQPFLAADFGCSTRRHRRVRHRLEARLKATNDAVDLGFLRARADIYRVRSCCSAPTPPRVWSRRRRWPTSRCARKAPARAASICELLKGAYQTDFRRDPESPLETKPKPAQPPAAAPAAAPAAPFASAALFSVPFFTLAAAQPTTTFSTVRIAAAREPSFSLAAISLESVTRLGIGDVRGQLALPGLVERTATVAERLTPPPSVEAYNASLASKLTALNTLAALIRGGAAGERPVGIALGDLPVPGYRFKPATDPPAPRVKGTLADVLADSAKPIASQEYEDQDRLPEASARHEADYFNAAVKAIDNAIALMRLVEGRVALYEKLVADARAVRDDLLRYIAIADARLRTIGVELEEARHDVGVASALLAEEQGRVDDLNARRQATIAQHVTHYVPSSAARRPHRRAPDSRDVRRAALVAGRRVPARARRGAGRDPRVRWRSSATPRWRGSRRSSIGFESSTGWTRHAPRSPPRAPAPRRRW